MSVPIPQPFTAYLPPCLEQLYEEGANWGKDDTKSCLRSIALYYRTLAKKSGLEEEFYNLIPMMQFINGRSHEKLTDEEIEAINEDVRSTSRTKITCRELKKSATLKECCVSDDCKLFEGVIDADPAAKRAADIILARGDVLKFLVNQAQKNHKGDTDVLKHLLASIASSCSLTSMGIQPELNGAKGHGKTDAVRAVFHLIPERWKLAASISAKALYYHKDLPAGAIIFSDDVQWSDDLISTVKRSMGNFQDPQVHYTLDKNRNPLPQTMPPRLVWWLSSVESVADDQLKDRQYSLDIDEGGKHSHEVSDYLKVARAEKQVRFSVTKGTEIARAIIDKIKSHDRFKVLIPCAKFADWKVKDDHRMQNKFWDLVEAFAILRHEQRYMDADGWFYATVEDFNEAKTIFMRRKANHRTHLTNAQTKIVKSVIALRHDPDGATQGKIAENLRITYQAVSKGLAAIEANTRFIVHEKGAHGEKFYRCTVSGLEVCYGEGDIVTLPEDYKDPFNLIQPSFNHDSTIHSTIKTNNNNNNTTTIQPSLKEQRDDKSCLVLVEGNIAMPAKMVETVETCHPIATGLVESRLNEVETGLPIAKCLVETGLPIAKGMVESTILRFLQPVPAFVAEDLRTHGRFQPEDVATIPSINAKGLISKGCAVLVTPGHQPARKDAPPLVCAGCGADLTGKSQIEKNGRLYCTQIGCGYQARAEAKT